MVQATSVVGLSDIKTSFMPKKRLKVVANHSSGFLQASCLFSSVVFFPSLCSHALVSSLDSASGLHSHLTKHYSLTPATITPVQLVSDSSTPQWI